MTPLRQRFTELLCLRGYAARTHESYISAIAALARHYGKSPERLTNEEIRSYVLTLHSRGLSFSTINVAVSAMRLFYTELIGRPIPGLMRSLPRPGVKILRPRVYSRQELARLFSVGCSNSKQRAFLMTVYGAGLRLHEACHLRIEDIESDRSMLRINRGKGRKDRYSILSPWLLDELRSYYKSWRPVGWLFPASHDPRKPMIDGTAQKLFYSALHRAGLPRRGGIHCLRHSFATHLLEQGVDMAAIKKMMGHQHFGTTAKYLHVTREPFGGLQSPFTQETAQA